MINKDDPYIKDVKTLDQLLRDRSEKKLVFTFYSDWDSFLFWKPMNWRGFTFIYLYIEFNEYKWIELDITILGFHFSLDWFRI